MSVTARIDSATDLGYPQLHAVVGEYRERETELPPIEGSRRLTDDHGVKAPLRVLERLEESRDSGRLFHGRDRLCPISKNSATIRPP